MPRSRRVESPEWIREWVECPVCLKRLTWAVCPVWAGLRHICLKCHRCLTWGVCPEWVRPTWVVCLTWVAWVCSHSSLLAVQMTVG